MDKLKEFKEKNFEELDRFLPVVEKVHGPHHNEIFDVAKVYGKLKAKIDAGDQNLDYEFKELRALTDNYKVPNDVCETYEKIYNVLEELNRIYESK